ncbi:hypothetical protein G6010_09740 [Dietzia sp. SLG510A3-3B2-2]|jgi:hypothetical protein|nr:hypothetical protein [Dietzia sp. SLG510A3-40A3]MBB1009828.1 hypothetical protein [Dietzia sp. SLG510A3-3B2-2]
MTFTTRKAAAVAAAAALAISGATGVANAQGSEELGTLSSDVIGSAGSSELSSGGGSVPENLGSLILDANATDEGSLDTSGSALLGEPSTGSLAPLGRVSQ